MSFPRVLSLGLLSFVLMFSNLQRANADSIFDFENVTLNTATPFTSTVNGLSATFGGAASVCDSTGLFQNLTGHILIQNYCGPATESGPFAISFSSPLTAVSFNYGTAGGVGSLTLQAFQGTTSVGTATFTSAVPTGQFNGEGVASFSGAFNRLTLTSRMVLALDNVQATTGTPTVPEPASFALLAAGAGFLAVFARQRRS